MTFSPQLLLIGAVAAVGVLHTMVPDHWAPITLLARQQGWSKLKTARTALLAGTGHVLSTLAIAAVVWIAGVSVTQPLGHWVDIIASAALVLFGGWIAVSAWRDMHGGGGHGHSHGHSHGHTHALPAGSASGVHGPELQVIPTHDGPMSLSIYETDMPPHFRLTGGHFDWAALETVRPDGTGQAFKFVRKGTYWETTDAIPEPHGFDIVLKTGHGDHGHAYETRLAEHDHHGHDHDTGASKRTALLLIVGSSPMVEGIPAFFAASRYGVTLIAVMSLVFAATTIATYVILCVGSVAGLQRISLGPIERYGEVLSGAFIALIGVAFGLWALL
jgi:hypothetical protein